MPEEAILSVSEGSTRDVTFTLYDSAGVVVPLASITSAFLTLWDVDTYEPGGSPTVGIINGRESQNVKNANNVTIHSTSGLVTWTMQAADNPIVTARRQVERHRAKFRFVVGSAELNYKFRIEVRNSEA
jgi:hypothetical protein